MDRFANLGYFHQIQSSIYLVIALILIAIILREIFFYQARQKPILYYMFMFPGIVLHELAHSIACLVTFTKIRSVTFFSKNGGFVMHEKPGFILISFFISIAPLLTGIAIIYLAVTKGLSPQASTGLISARTVIIIYFLSSIFLTMLPSKQDILNSFSAFAALSVAVVSYYLLSPNKDIFAHINLIFAFSIGILILLNLAMLIINKLWKFK